MPDELGPVHALLFAADYVIPPPPRKAGTAFERFAKQAACGAPVRVIFSMALDTEEPDACPRCTEVAIQWQADQQA